MSDLCALNLQLVVVAASCCVGNLCVLHLQLAVCLLSYQLSDLQNSIVIYLFVLHLQLAARLLSYQLSDLQNSIVIYLLSSCSDKYAIDSYQFTCGCCVLSSLIIFGGD